MTVLITGAEGFIGRKLAELLHAAGTGVVGLDVASAGPRPWPVVVGDVTDRGLVERLFAEHSISGVVHAGGVSGPHVCNTDPARVFAVNVGGTVNLFDAARKAKLAGRVVFLSSSSTYGQAAERSSRTTPVTEGLPLLASEPYGASKVTCEALVRTYVQMGWLDAVSLRVSIVYGPGRTTYCGISRMLLAAKAGEPITLDDGSDVPLPWVHIDDVVAAIRATLAAPKANLRETDTWAYNVTGPGTPTFRAMATVVRELVPGATVRDTGGPDAYEMNARTMSVAAAGRDLGWVPRVGIADGIRSLFAAMGRGRSPGETSDGLTPR